MLRGREGRKCGNSRAGKKKGLGKKKEEAAAANPAATAAATAAAAASAAASDYFMFWGGPPQVLSNPCHTYIIPPGESFQPCNTAQHH